MTSGARSPIAAVADAVVISDAGGDIVDANGEAGRLFGYAVDELRGRPVTVLIPRRFHAAHRTGMTRFVASGDERLDGHTRLLSGLRSDGSEIALEAILGSWRKGDALRVTAVMRERALKPTVGQLEEALRLERDAGARLEELDELKSTFLDVVAHDLRSPLTAIRATALALLGDLEAENLSTDQRRTLLEGVGSSVDAMRRVLDDLLNLEHVDSSGPLLRHQVVDVGELVRTMVQNCTGLLGDRPIRIDAGEAWAEVDPTAVERILENLLANVARHTEAGTPVSIEVHPDAESVRIVVTDAGPGVPAGSRRTVFQRGTRAGSDRTEGLGIGLSVVSRLAEAHGGAACVEPAPGGGASFRVSLPTAMGANVDRPVEPDHYNGEPHPQQRAI